MEINILAKGTGSWKPTPCKIQVMASTKKKEFGYMDMRHHNFCGSPRRGHIYADCLQVIILQFDGGQNLPSIGTVKNPTKEHISLPA